MRTTFSVVGLLSAAVLLSGCQSASAQNQQAPPKITVKTGLPVEPASASTIGYVSQWATDLSVHRNQTITHTSVMNDLGVLVIAEEPINLVTAVSLREGRLLWRQTIGQDDEILFKPLPAGADRILINTDKRVYLLEAATGRVRGISDLGSTVADGPVLVDDYAIFGGRSGEVFAHDIVAGWSKWEYRLSATILAGPVLSGNNAFVADSKGGYVMLTATGEQLWRNHTWGPVTAKPAAALDNVYIACRDRSLYCLDRLTGDDKWIYRVTVPLTTSPVPLGRYVFQAVEGEGLLAISADEGKKLWAYPDAAAQPVSLSDGKLVLQHASGIELIDTSTGRVVAAAPAKDLATVRPGPDDSLLVITNTGRVMRLNPQR